MVDTGARASSVIGTVSEKPFSGYTGSRMPSGASICGEKLPSAST
jgi:hypothetical protein